MSFDVSNYPKVQEWLSNSKEANRLGCMHLFDDALSAFHNAWAAEMLRSEKFSPEQRQWIRAVRLVGYDHPVLNDLWQNQVVTDGQRIFIPQQWLLQYVHETGPSSFFSEALAKRLEEVLERYPETDQSPEKTKQDLMDAGLSPLVERLFSQPKSTPLLVLEQAWKEKSPIPEEHQQPFLDFFKKLEGFSEFMDRETLWAFRDGLIEHIYEQWGDDFSWANQLIPQVLFQEWIRQKGAENWTAEELSSHPTELQQLWGLTGILVNFLNYNSGTGAFLRANCLGDVYASNSYQEDHFWWKATCQKVDDHGRVFLSLTFSRADERDDLVSGISGTCMYAKPISFAPLNTLAAFESPLLHLQKSQISPSAFQGREGGYTNMFSQLLSKDVEYLHAYLDVLKKDGWTETLDACVSSEEGPNPEELIEHTLWKDIFEHFKGQLEEDEEELDEEGEIAYQTKVEEVFEKVTFLMAHGLTLQSEQAKAEFLDWFTEVEMKDETQSFRLASLLLETRAFSSKSLLDAFFDKAQQVYEKEIARGQAWKPKVPFENRLTLLLEGPWVNWESFSKEDKHVYFDKTQSSMNGVFKEAMIALQREEMNEALSHHQGNTHKVRL